LYQSGKIGKIKALKKLQKTAKNYRKLQKITSIRQKMNGFLTKIHHFFAKIGEN